ncbi:MAG: hypothetical protein M0Z62_08735, partial [Actinomycetota bacterium]|nr:hypothetical protein [Actinomycetota bacterium]
MSDLPVTPDLPDPDGASPPGDDADHPVEPVAAAGPALPRRRRGRTALETLVVAAAALVPMLFSQPGVVADDTKTYLYLDPGRYLRQA